MYRITYEQGNGYYCGCCRQSWTNTVDLETPEEVQEWVNELAACKEFSVWEDDDDRDIKTIEKEFGVDIQNQFVPQQKEVDHIVAQRKRNKEKREQEEQKEQVKNLEERDQMEYLRLKEKYGN